MEVNIELALIMDLLQKSNLGGKRERNLREDQFHNTFRSQDKLFNASLGTNICLLLLFQIKSRATGTLEEMRLMWKPLATYCSLKSSSAALVMLGLLSHILPIKDRVVLDLFPLRFVTKYPEKISSIV